MEEFRYEPILLRYGGAKKSCFEMNEEELKEVARIVLARAKEKAFYWGRPIVWAKDGKVYREWSDGSIEQIIEAN